MGLSSFLNKVGDIFVPKEIAPYLGAIAPMVAPQLGIFGSMALSQLGSIKQHGGKLDPYSAAATALALSSPQARAIRRAGQLDPTRGTVGQRLSAGFAQSLPGKGGEMTAFQRALDPRVSIAQNDYGNYFENQFLAESQSGALNNQMMTSPFDSDALTKKGNIMSDAEFTKLSEGEYDRLYGDFMTKEEMDKKLMLEDIEAGTAPGKGKYDKFQEMNLQEQQEYIESFGRSGGDISSTFMGKAGEFGSGLAGGIFPGFGEYDPVTGRMLPGSFDFGKALQTVAVAGTVGSLKAIGEELKKQKQLDEQKQREIWTTYFKSYERAAGKPYSESRYPDANIMEKFNRFMLATGGRVGYNMGGGIMAASGVPQGMQVDGRNGAFIPMGVEEKADDVPAMLSKNEFVMTADAVKAAGDGDANKGAQRMYDLMHNLEAQV